ncbi:hypothetical protein [Erwinia typographi]|uniref:hypothetical protein n=1 Tax=Erwinia typographi TaxID=371042 RepID=UPI000AE304F2|nr:hypothetical protein [Erwinia typographi]
MDRNANVLRHCMGACVMDDVVDENDREKPAPLDGWQLSDAQRKFIESLREDDDEVAQ